MAIALLRAGAKVVVTASNKVLLDQLAAESGAGARVAVVPADLADPAQLASLVRDAETAFGRIDILVNNAALATDVLPKPDENNPLRFWDISDGALRRVFAVNTIAPQILASNFAPKMAARGWGRIIDVSTSLNTMLTYFGYGSSKAAMEANAAAMAAALAGTGVTVNALLPGGPVDTDMTATLPFPRAQMLRPEVFDAPLLFLTSDQAGDITGRRFIAAQWDTSLPPKDAATQAGAALAWTGFGAQAITAKV